MTIKFHPSVTLAEAKHAADLIGCEIRNDGKGDHIITPKDFHDDTVLCSNCLSEHYPGQCHWRPED